MVFFFESSFDAAFEAGMDRAYMRRHDIMVSICIVFSLNLLLPISVIMLQFTHIVKLSVRISEFWMIQLFAVQVLN
jgi:hypothetical protein